MESRTTLTIITPVYNCEEYISETVNSVLKFAENINFEYIVVNDGSKDGTLRLLEEFKNRIILINQDNSGEAQAINNALNLSRGECCLVVSADDPLCDSELFSLSLQILDSNPAVVATYPDWFMIDRVGNILAKIKTEEYSENTLIGKFKCIPGPGAIFRTNIARQVEGRNSYYKFVSDYDFWLKLSRYGAFQRIPFHLAQWRHHESSTSIKLRGFRMANERILVIRNFLEKFEIDPRVAKSAKAFSYYHASLLSYFSPEVPGRKWLMEAFRAYGKWLPGMRIRVVFYILLLPYSFRSVDWMRKNRILSRLLPQG